MASPNFPPQPECPGIVTVRQRDHGLHGQGIVGSVQCAGAACKGAGFRPAPALQRRERPPPMAGRGTLDRQHLAQVGLAAVAQRALHVSGPARRTAFHERYSR